MSMGKVYLVGAGPGDPELLTVKAVRAIAAADVVVYDRLVPDGILATIGDGVARINVGKQAGSHPVPQGEINDILVKLGRAGRTVVRLKGGDPFIFGRGSEEAAELAAAGIPYEVIPGITAAQGCAAAARVPLTHRGLATGVRYVTGHRKADEALDLDWDSLADPETTLVVYMGLANVEEIMRNLIARGLPGSLPVLAVCQGTTAQERRISTRLDALVAVMREAAFTGPVLFIIGRVAGMALQRSEQNHETNVGAISVVA
ncbi:MULTISPECIES: uroporphyrinogen-III C-methyltransferase [unclassified Bradyrhizobium]|uniref:uroporphyrinogen-III C-methyltransferase n=1 Tax=unclassified Bradyrhizobium TaxID=2631580 RepID=UPI0028EFA64C|nr:MULTISPECIES: uroporphyrinogen-III C-methyltransferase [unclassified Bradyrhizobium]